MIIFKIKISMATIAMLYIAVINFSIHYCMLCNSYFDFGRGFASMADITPYNINNGKYTHTTVN